MLILTHEEALQRLLPSPSMTSRKLPSYPYILYSALPSQGIHKLQYYFVIQWCRLDRLYNYPTFLPLHDPTLVISGNLIIRSQSVVIDTSFLITWIISTSSSCSMSLVFVYASKPWLSKTPLSRNCYLKWGCVTGRVLFTLKTAWLTWTPACPV